ncbi:MAG: GMC family oxidoreductase, partial [Candidatus Eremiobacteraeota bacterium]|nr:GMC family oxidoreductase [Candidatus Eremiobacteraeota bacterium]
HLSGPSGTRINYRLSTYDARHLLRGIDALVAIAFAGGAERVITTHATELSLERASATAAQRAAFRDAIMAAGARPNRLGVYSGHQMGTCRMHRDRRQGVVDEHGAVHGLRGLVVTDASVFPLASGVNPMLTIMALAHRSAQFHASA